MIIDKLIEKINLMGNPSVIGLDPRPEYIPDFIKAEAEARHGRTLRAGAEALYMFNKGIIDGICHIVPAVKPQIAMYEQYGGYGIDAYIRTVQYAREKDMLVIGDIKRGDIASTAESYADGHIGRVKIAPDMGEGEEVFGEDFITLNPYLGSDSIAPFLGNCKKYKKGLFILVKTSNPGSCDIQDLSTEAGTVYEAVGRLVSKWGEDLIGRYGYSSVGAVVGATFPEQLKRLRAMLPHTFFLVPGYGAQGGKASDLSRGFDKDGKGVIVNSSRGVIAAYQKEPYNKEFTPAEYAEAAGRAAEDMRKELQYAQG